MTGCIDSEELVSRIDERLAGRRLIWFGIRGEDAEPLLQVPRFSASFSITAPLKSGTVSSVTLEELRGSRPDLDRYDIDIDASAPAAELRRLLLKEVSQRCVVMTYRPAALVTALGFAMSETMLIAGLNKDRQAAFENKPWVETSLASRGVDVLRWRYVADEHKDRVKRMLATEGPLVLRASRASGGVGMAHIATEEEIEAAWPQQSEAFVAVAPYLEGAQPLNVSGCVYRDGGIRLHPPSVQLIGIPACTDRPFGYCGNDFALAKTIDPVVLRRLDELARRVGSWLHEENYVGAYGLDALLWGESVLFTEVNARFQGSSAVSAEIAQSLDVPDLFLDHLAASLGETCPDDGMSLAEWASQQAPRSHVVVHNTSGESISRHTAPLARIAGGRLAQLPPRGVTVEAGGTLGRIVRSGASTASGFELESFASDDVDSLLRAFTRSADCTVTA